jgi:hypothetical protein
MSGGIGNRVMAPIRMPRVSAPLMLHLSPNSLTRIGINSFSTAAKIPVSIGLVVEQASLLSIPLSMSGYFVT